MRYVGIDPGVSGAVAVITPAPLVVPFKGLTLHDVWEVFSELTAFEAKPIIAYLERVHSMPKQGVASTFKFGQSYGNLEAFLTAAEIPFVRIAPSEWQRKFGLISKKGEAKTAKKNRHKALAQELFPSVKVTHAVADALLIAEYGRRTHHAL